MTDRAWIIVNRRARGLADDASPLLAQCRAHATVRVVETRSLEELDEVVARIAAAPAPVVLAGGDGSHAAGLTALERAFGDRELPALALMPGGTVNTVARGWGMQGSAVAYTRRLLDAVVAGTAARTRRPTLRVQLGDEARLSSVSRLAFIIGAGLVSRFFEVYDARGADGLMTAARIVARVFAGSFVGGALARRVLEPAPCEITVDGEPASFDRLSLVCAGVVADVGLGLRLLYRAEEAAPDRARFHVVATPLGPRALGPQMFRVLAGKALRGPRVDTLAQDVTLAFPSGSGAVVLDGDLFRSDRVAISGGPSIVVLQP